MSDTDQAHEAVERLETSTAEGRPAGIRPAGVPAPNGPDRRGGRIGQHACSRACGSSALERAAAPRESSARTRSTNSRSSTTSRRTRSSCRRSTASRTRANCSAARTRGRARKRATSARWSTRSTARSRPKPTASRCRWSTRRLSTRPSRARSSAGIPVVSYNADVEPPNNERLAYIGQNLEVSGEKMGEHIAELVPSGDVALFIATPGSLNIQPRIDGALKTSRQSRRSQPTRSPRAPRSRRSSR